MLSGREMLQILLYSILLLIIQPITGYNIAFKSNSSINDIGTIFLRYLGDTKIFCRNRVLEFNLELEDINKVDREISSVMNIMIDICNNAKYSSMCHIEMEELHVLYRMFQDKYKIIDSASFQTDLNDRKKRNLDEIEDIIQKSITLNDISYSNTKQNIDELKSITHQLINSHEKLNTDIDYINFNTLSQLIILNIKRHINLYNKIIDISIDKNPKKLVDLISLNILESEMEKLQIQIDKEHCHMPIENKHHEIISYLKLAEIQFQISRNYFVVSIYLPTFFKTTFNLAQAISIPFRYRSATYIVKPVNQYYLTYKKDFGNEIHSIPLSVEEKLSCKNIQRFNLCYTQKATIILNIDKFENLFNPESYICKGRDIQDFEWWKAVYDVCKPKKMPHINQIIRLNNTDYFIYVINTTSVRIACNEEHQVYKVSEPILIKNLDDECSIILHDNVHMERKTVYAKTFYQESYGFSAYVNGKSLIHREDTQFVEPSEVRNLQSKFINLHEKIDSYMDQPKIVQNILKSAELIAIISVVSVLLVLTWTLIGYCNFTIRRKIANFLKGSLKSENSMSTLPPELNCQFNFLQPTLPPKLRRSPSGMYDKPRTPSIKITPVEVETVETVITIPEKPIVQYASIIKKKPIIV